MLDLLPGLPLQLIADQLVAMTEGEGSEAIRARTAAALLCVGCCEATTQIGEWLYDALDPGCLAARAAADAHVQRMRQRIEAELADPDAAGPVLVYGGAAEMNSMSRRDLAERCARAKVPVSGSKVALLERLRRADIDAVAAWRTRRDVQMEIMMKPAPSPRRCPVRPYVRKLVRAVRKNDKSITHAGAKALYKLSDPRLAQLRSEVRKLSGGARVRLYDLADVIRARNRLYGVSVPPAPDEHAIMLARAQKRKREATELRRDRHYADRLSSLLAGAGISREEAIDVSPRAAGAICAYLQGRRVPTLEEDVAHAADCLRRRDALARALWTAGIRAGKMLLTSEACEAYVRGDSVELVAEIVARLKRG